VTPCLMMNLKTCSQQSPQNLPRLQNGQARRHSGTYCYAKLFRPSCRFVRYGFAVLAESLQMNADGVGGHLASFTECAAVGHQSRQQRNSHLITALDGVFGQLPRMRLTITLRGLDLTSERLKNHCKSVSAGCQPLRCCFAESNSGHVKSLAPVFWGVNLKRETESAHVEAAVGVDGLAGDVGALG
jgi:hypothetical protein